MITETVTCFCLRLCFSLELPSDQGKLIVEWQLPRFDDVSDGVGLDPWHVTKDAQDAVSLIVCPHFNDFDVAVRSASMDLVTVASHWWRDETGGLNAK